MHFPAQCQITIIGVLYLNGAITFVPTGFGKALQDQFDFKLG